jgi:hypothetical protein
MQQQREAFACTRDELTASISANYGNPIEQIRNEIARIDNAGRRSASAQNNMSLSHRRSACIPLWMPTPSMPTAAPSHRGSPTVSANATHASNQLTEAGVTVRELGRLHGELTGELESLCQRRSNIPR